MNWLSMVIPLVILCNSVSVGRPAVRPDSTAAAIRPAVVAPRPPVRAFQTTIGYWNDNNMHMADWLERIFGRGRDDYVTASFWLRLARGKPGRWWLADVYYNIITNKAEEYRTDLLTFRLSLDRKIPTGSFQAGLGVITSGDFRGDLVQNSYHTLLGVRTLNLPYVGDGRTGLASFLHYRPLLYQNDHSSIKGYATNSFHTAVGPSKWSAGIELNLDSRAARKPTVISFQTRGGYTSYYRLERHLSPLFGRGFTWGALISYGRIGGFNLAGWYTNNQYGVRQPDYGISVTFRWQGRRYLDLTDVIFP